jgi:hypothetical protein
MARRRRLALSVIATLLVATAGAAETVRVAADRAEVRQEAQAGGGVLGTASKGTVFQVLGREGGWIRVAYPIADGAFYAGYIPAVFCEDARGAAPSAAKPVTPAPPASISVAPAPAPAMGPPGAAAPATHQTGLTVAATKGGDAKVTFQSDPPGATLYEVRDEDGTAKPWGYTPRVLEYPAPTKWTECMNTRPVRVRWLSGAEAELDSLQLCPKDGKKRQFTFMRPAGVPGAEIDGQFALQLGEKNAPKPSVYVPPAKPTFCTSRLIGTQVFTNCY